MSLGQRRPYAEPTGRRRATGGGVVIENPDHRVHDAVALDEIELYGNLMIAASESDGPLSQDQIDEILGVKPACLPR
jgi:hypothetical protein